MKTNKGILQTELIGISNESEYHLIESFLKSAGQSLLYFRYFEKRGVEVLKNHALTLLLLLDKKPVGYGHLDRKADGIWLGLCIAESYQGKGLGLVILRKLLSSAEDLLIPEIFLSVDSNNVPAKKLYNRHGFRLMRQDGDREFYCWSNQKFLSR